MTEFSVAKIRLNDVKPKMKDPGSDKYVTTCSDCRWGIFTNHARVWSNRGLIHVDCANPRGEGEIKVIT